MLKSLPFYHTCNRVVKELLISGVTSGSESGQWAWKNIHFLLCILHILGNFGKFLIEKINLNNKKVLRVCLEPDTF